MNTPLDTQTPMGDDGWLEERFRAAADTVATRGHPKPALDTGLQLVSHRARGAHGRGRQWALAAAAAAVLALVGALVAIGDQGDADDQSGFAATNAPDLVARPSPPAATSSATRAAQRPATVIAAHATASNSAPPDTTTPATTATPAVYTFAGIAPLPSCPTDTNGEPAGKWDDGQTAGVWYVQPDGTCIAIEVEWADDMPADAAPLDLPGYPDLFATSSGGIQQIYARVAPGAESYHPDGGWVVLTARADAPTADVVSFIIVPSN